MLVPGQRIRIKNKRNEPEPEGTVILHDAYKMLVLVEVFTAERGTSTWWIPDYMAIPIDQPTEIVDVSSG